MMYDVNKDYVIGITNIFEYKYRSCSDTFLFIVMVKMFLTVIHMYTNIKIWPTIYSLFYSFFNKKIKCLLYFFIIYSYLYFSFSLEIRLYYKIVPWISRELSVFVLFDVCHRSINYGCNILIKTWFYPASFIYGIKEIKATCNANIA